MKECPCGNAHRRAVSRKWYVPLRYTKQGQREMCYVSLYDASRKSCVLLVQFVLGRRRQKTQTIMNQEKIVPVGTGLKFKTSQPGEQSSRIVFICT